jgi:hypothetical protein
VIALYSKRQRPTGNFFFLPIRHSELSKVGVAIQHHPEDETPCGHANSRLHYNATADELKLRALCRLLLENGRGIVRLAEKALFIWLAASEQEGCLAGTKGTKCLVANCPSAAG